MQDEFLRLQGMLNKTILFVTHDFDEALRLADRIAIMKDGVIEQCDTPANIVLHPATEYVAKFTNEVPRERVLTCKNVMEEVGNTSDFSDIRVPHNAIIEKIAEAVLNEPKSVAVVDDNNNMIGVLNRKSIIHILFGKDDAKPLSANQAAGQ
jgi:glycine betaine/proline transport system ATP-binding protein